MSNEQISTHDANLYAINNRLTFRLFQLGNTLDRMSSKELGVSPVHWAVLGALSREQVREGMSFSDLTEYLGVSRQNLDGVLKRLERDQHVVRFADQVDRRAKKVMMTEEGRIFWDQLELKIYEYYRQAMDGFAFDDKVTFVHFLNKLNKGMQAVKLEANKK
ncbi:MarR family transcriptional regulator [Acinetobacter wuhouensis]|uniref:MarR family transcriptional regulator n=1 Tax=Acinetobacter wuhouensis TaxID=1879050 RepID=A0A385C3A8_9GAMM|nr:MULTISPECIES: MarR family transcriptional regulator [Acinetobacter]AXQ22220.1 MarR family transcriptional regulator [Acinetobacter wuhouensis]AYO54563.1 MarR family transcriptional regulator [Acinetobacter wuhouensis]RZG48703.1 MarR family transcriptional regulator [Acinetobacter wuhouensis]RZG72987.1 MarR family transcriptional regulator [Acinetobacter wuhouensis]RZG75049.1 MarR family transcriptional regulator [Acinetobacter sp. WCHAc060025]